MTATGERVYKLVGHDRKVCPHEEFEHGTVHNPGCKGKKGRTSCPCGGHWKEQRRGA